ncbi:metal-dependent hydrolase [Streptomyces sp. NPDC002130]|uniref:metal-dependent hydrolase n=1 Tax=Streptomyces sp. NPDC002130 TaxID=3155568 RepID=UPI003328A4C7
MGILRGLTQRPIAPPGRVAIRPRRVDFDWEKAPLVWLPNEPIASYLLGSMNLVIPEGERMMIQAFEQALPDVHDEKLREDMLGFMGQELLHAEAHDEVMNQVFTRHGIDPAPFNRQMQYFFRKTLGVGDDTDPLQQRGVGLKALSQGIDTTTPGGRLFFHMLAAIAEFEHDLIVERTHDGLAAARARGRKGGPKFKMTPTKIRQARAMYDEGGHTVQEIADTFGVSRPTIYRHLAEHVERA